jgi:arylsulfatase A-like enzyme
MDVEPDHTASAAEFTFRFWVVFCSALFGLCAALDLGLGGEGLSAVTLFWTLSLGCAVGIVHGAFLGGAFGLLRGRYRIVRVLFWSMLAVVAVVWSLSELGVMERLEGEYRQLAVLTLVFLFLAGAAAVALFVLLQPTLQFPRGWLGARSWKMRLAVAVGLLMVAGLAATADRNFYQDGYAVAHTFLRAGGYWCLLFGIWLLLGKAPGLSRKAALVYVVAVSVQLIATAATLTTKREGELNVILKRPYAALALGTARGLSDIDLDGYSSLLGGGDCAAFSADVNPGAAEIPGNGLDDNCRLGDASLAMDSLTEISWPREPSPTSVVLITVDTLSAPYMSLYGGKKKTSPGIDAWARRAAVFDRAYTSGGWTSLAISSMMRGVYPRRLKWTRLFETNRRRLLTHEELKQLPRGEAAKQMFGLPLDDPRLTLPIWLSSRGMATRAVVNDGKSEFLDPKFQSKGFDQFVDMDGRAPGGSASDEQVTRVATGALKELERLQGKPPFFLWVHYFGPHSPNSEHRGVPRFGSDGVGKYEHEIASLDRDMTSLLKGLDSLGKKRKLAVILTSDHGEVIYPTWRGHGREPLESGIHVPLIIKAAGFESGRYDAPVSLVDIFPTIAALTESPMPEHIDGVDLMRVVRGDPEVTARTLISETWRYGKDGKLLSEYVAAFDGKRKLTIEMRTQARTLREQKFPENEKQNLLNGRAKDLESLDNALARHLEAGGSATFVR